MLMMFIFSNLVLYFTLKRYRNNLDVIIYVIGIYLVAILVPFLFYFFLDIKTKSFIQINEILFFNSLFFSFLIWRTFLPSDSFKLFSTLKIKFKNQKKNKIWFLPANIRNIILKSSIAFSLYKLFSKAIVDLSASRTEMWQESVLVEAESGMGVVGILTFILTGLFYVCTYEGLQSISLETRKKTIILFIAYQVIAILQAILFGLYRSPVIFEFITIIIVYHFYYKAFSLRKLKVGAIVLVMILPFYFSIAAYVRDGNLNVGRDNISVFHGLSGLATALEFADLHERLNNKELPYENGKQFFYNFISFVPRVLWKNKPYTSFSFRKSGEIYGEVGVKSWVHTYTLWGEGYNQFGLIGTFLATLQLFLIIFFFTNWLLKKPIYGILFLQIFLLKIPILLRGDLSTFFGVTYKIIFSLIFIWIFKEIIKVFSKNILKNRKQYLS
jgi:oligosaccharide repeat unit polymerase